MMSCTKMSTQKLKLTIKQQIQNMKSNGITFAECSEEQAQVFLSEHSYYFKIKAYAKCFRKYTNKMHKQVGNYIKLDFNQLVTFSRLDMKLRQCILSMTLDIEHALKVNLNKLISENEKEDGYKITNEFMQKHQKVKTKIDDIVKHANSNPYTYTLVEKYQDDFASWNLVEILTFGDLIYFYKFYNAKYNLHRHKKITNLLCYVKFLRNAAAHNNCLLNQLGVNEFRIIPSRDAKALLQNTVKTISSKRCSSAMKIPVLHDFSVCVLVFVELIKSKNAYNRIILLLDEFVSLVEAKKDMFSQELNIISGFNFLKDLIQFLVSCKIYCPCVGKKGGSPEPPKSI